MINRYANLLFTIGRYLERAENYARIININYTMRHDLKDSEQGYAWERLAAAVGDVNELKHRYPHANEWTILNYLTFEQSNPDCLLSTIQQVRNHIRTIRPMLPVELWDIINAFYLWLKDQDVSHVMAQSPYLFYKRISESLSLFNGAADSAMVRGENWNLLQAGKFLERIRHTLYLVNASYSHLITDAEWLDDENRYNRLMVLLKSCGGYEAFRKFHANHMKLSEVMVFLLQNSEFPRSVQFATTSLRGYLESDPVQLPSIEALSNQVSYVIACIRANQQDSGEINQGDELRLIQQLLDSYNDLRLGLSEGFFQEATHSVMVHVGGR
ncbi:hypothetical protein A8709_14985 [Paenibacillus pectinilyticus]|uniref:DUF403 domain-containing protein n=1 Tax=Paenibacillus pectinilyticus TaxID=512399 RepID=A0A1C1A4A3_9BACL|nr:alpha-E domain-containing protein [Paenibacillus pectinilyticus]OCT15385.1 hypothetical protein A8709_14985 [Paenibacillus pectinilyticus]